MAIVIAGKPYGLGAITALLVLIACFVFLIVGGASSLAILLMIAALALSYLIG